MTTKDGEWMTIAEAAERLGTSVTAIRSRVQRRTLRFRPGNQSNDRKVRVFVPTDAVAPPTDAAPDVAVEPVVPAVLVDELRGRIGELEGRVVELRAELADERAGRERERTEARLERQTLVAVIEGMARAARPVSWFDRVNEWIRSRSRPAD